MNYKETLEYIKASEWKGSRPGLGRTETLLSMMGDVHKKIKYVHVAGTNGKGSVCAMLSNILKESGYRTGTYISPGLLSFNGRMSVNGKPIEDGKLAEIATYVRSFADKMEDQPTEFELTTAIAFEYFYREKCDIAVLEVGMGGRLDSTNVIDSPVVSVITGIALDHTAFLGNTVEKIAAEKAGIIKKGRPAVYGGDDENAFAVIKNKAKETGSALYRAKPEELKDFSVTLEGSVFSYCGKKYACSLFGWYQRSNISTALKTVSALKKEGFPVKIQAVKKGLSTVYWPARFEILSKEPLVIYDGAHNPQGLTSCVETVKKLFGRKKLVLLTGVMADKDFSVMLPLMKSIAKKVYTVRPDNHRALGERKYAALFCKDGIEAHSSRSVENGVKKALEASKKEGVPLLALGTLYMYKDVRNAVFAALDKKK